MTTKTPFALNIVIDFNKYPYKILESTTYSIFKFLCHISIKSPVFFMNWSKPSKKRWCRSPRQRISIRKIFRAQLIAKRTKDKALTDCQSRRKIQSKLIITQNKKEEYLCSIIKICLMLLQVSR